MEIEDDLETQSVAFNGSISDQAPSQDFSLLCDKVLNVKVKLASCCPSMDLVSVITIDNVIMIHRLNWQRLWYIPSSDGRIITCATWHPDGKTLVTGYQDGHFSMWNIETGQLAFSSLEHELLVHLSPSTTLSPISFLTWTEKGETSTLPLGSNKLKATSIDLAITKLAPLWPLSAVDAARGSLFSCNQPNASINPLQPDTARTAKINRERRNEIAQEDSSTSRLERSCPENLSILLVADQSPCIHLYALGILPIANINVFPLAQSTLDSKHRLLDCRIEAAHFSSDLAHLSLVTSISIVPDHDSPSSSSHLSSIGHCQDSSIPPITQTLYLSLNTGILSHQTTEILAVVWQFILLYDLSHRIQAITEKMATEWDNAIAPYYAKLQHLQSNIKSQGLKESIEELFETLLVQGLMPSLLETFLTQTFNLTVLHRTIQQINLASSTLIYLSNQHLQSTIERLVFRIGILRGYNRFKKRFECIGLHHSNLGSLYQVATHLLVHGDTFSNLLVQVKPLYDNFFGWLLKILITSIESHPNGANKYKDLHDYKYKEEWVQAYLKLNILDDLVHYAFYPKDSMETKTESQESTLKSNLHKLTSTRFGSNAVDPNLKLLQQIISLPEHIQKATGLMQAFLVNEKIPLPSNFASLCQLLHSELIVACQHVVPTISASFELRFHLKLATTFDSLSDFSVKGEGQAASINRRPMNSFLPPCILFGDLATRRGEHLAYFDQKDDSIWMFQLKPSPTSSTLDVQVAVFELHIDLSESISSLLIDLKHYKGKKMMALLLSQDVSTHASTKKVNSKSHLVQFSTDSLSYYPLQVEEINQYNGVINYFEDIVMMNPYSFNEDSLLDWIGRSRTLTVFEAESVSLSGQRGIGLVLPHANKRIMLFDLESNPEE